MSRLCPETDVMNHVPTVRRKPFSAFCVIKNPNAISLIRHGESSGQWQVIVPSILDQLYLQVNWKYQSLGEVTDGNGND